MAHSRLGKRRLTPEAVARVDTGQKYAAKPDCDLCGKWSAAKQPLL